MRNAEVIRQWKILKRIEAGRFTSTRELADEHGVTERTIRRDLEALQEAGFPLYDERADGRRIWRLVEGYKARLGQSFTMSELAALHFGRNLMSFLGGSPFAQDLESAFEKIREALPERSLPYLSRVQEIFAARPDPRKDYSDKQEVIASVIDAILHERRARIDYYSFSSRRAKSYEVEPYKVVYHHGGLYLFARAEEYAEVRTFAVERIRRIEVLEQTFEIPEDFSVAEHSRSAFGIMGGKPENVELLFDGDAVAYIRERVWHESQELEESPDGSLRVRMHVAPGRELKAWIKGYLPDVEVLAPARLRREIAEDVERARARQEAPRKRR